MAEGMIIWSLLGGSCLKGIIMDVIRTEESLEIV